jgi:hypothetical protein
MNDLRTVLTDAIDELDHDDVANTIADALEGLVPAEAVPIIAERLGVPL